MTFVAVVTGALALVSALVVALALAIVAVRAVRRRRELRQRAVAEPLRPLLLEVAVGEGDEAAAAAAALAALEPRVWRTVEPAVLAVLGKVRGDGQGLLVELLAARGVLARALARTASRSAVRRAAGAELLGAAGWSGGVPALVALLGDGDAEVRLVAARALGRAGVADAAAATSALVGALAGERPVAPPDVVARALLLLGTPAAPALVTALAHPAPLVRLTAAEVLGRLGATTAARPLEDLVLRDPVSAVRSRAATALGRLGVPASGSALRAATSPSAPPAVRRAAAAALGEVGDPAALRCLWGLLDDGDVRLADTAATALLQLGAPGARVLAQVASQEEAGADRAVGRAHEVVACAVIAEVLPPASLAEVRAVVSSGAGRHARDARLAGVGA